MKWQAPFLRTIQIICLIRILKKCLEISHLPDSVLNKLDGKGNDKMALDFAVQLSKTHITDEYELNEIIRKISNITKKNIILIVNSIPLKNFVIILLLIKKFSPKYVVNSSFLLNHQ
jgi:hypothetical protein